MLSGPLLTRADSYESIVHCVVYGALAARHLQRFLTDVPTSVTELR